MFVIPWIFLKAFWELILSGFGRYYFASYINDVLSSIPHWEPPICRCSINANHANMPCGRYPQWQESKYSQRRFSVRLLSNTTKTALLLSFMPHERGRFSQSRFFGCRTISNVSFPCPYCHLTHRSFGCKGWYLMLKEWSWVSSKFHVAVISERFDLS